MPETKSEWVTINKTLLEDLLQVSENDPRTKELVKKLREGMKRGGGKTSTWVDPLPRSMEG